MKIAPEKAGISFIGILYVVFGVAGQCLINGVSAVCTAAVAVSSLLAFHIRRESKWKLFAGIAAVNTVGIVLESWYIATAVSVLNILFGLTVAVTGIKYVYARNTGWLLKISFPVLSILGLFCAAATLLVTFFPSTVMLFLRENVFRNTNVTDIEQTKSILDNDAKLVSDIQYDSEAANGYLDIYFTANAYEENPLTVIYIHGGGYIWGDKADGGPNSGNNAFKNGTIYYLVEAGYNVVSFNYALAPEYPYPVAASQLNRGLCYLKENAKELGINMDSVILVGVSAGGNLAGVVANIQTNPEYAAAVEETPVLTNGEIKGIIFEGGLVDNSQFGVTHNLLFDYIFYNMGRVYLGVNDLMHSDKVATSNVIDYVTEAFPASFISDGNSATFYEQAYALNGRLIELGVYTQFNYFPVEQAGELKHGFEESGSKWGELSIQNMLRFLEYVR